MVKSPNNQASTIRRSPGNAGRLARIPTEEHLSYSESPESRQRAKTFASRPKSGSPSHGSPAGRRGSLKKAVPHLNDSFSLRKGGEDVGTGQTEMHQ
jgi:hypothetical protein